jgi:Ferritin-like domain
VSREASRVQRRAFLAMAGAAAAAGCGGGSKTSTNTIPTTAQRVSDVPGAPDDPSTIAYALRLEQVQSDLYRQIAQIGIFKGRDLDRIKAFGAEEDEHVATLTDALRQVKVTPAPAPKTKLPLGTRHSALATALRLENLTAAAYLGQFGRIHDSGVLSTLLSIHSVEARHAATLSLMLDKPVTPTGAFARPANMATALQVLDLYTA